jgi:putative protein kinase ArgK-like GTPase of G3E family
MTAEYGAPSQLEKIEMLDYADLVVINKFTRRGSEDALRDVRKQCGATGARSRRRSRSCRSSVPAPPTSTTPGSTPSMPTWSRP